MKLSDFSKGQEVHIVKLNQGRSADAILYQKKVELVGRKYITLCNGDKYEENEECLRKSKDWGERTYLFPTLEQAKDFLEKKEFIIKLSQLNYSFFEKCSLDVLRKAKELLNI